LNLNINSNKEQDKKKAADSAQKNKGEWGSNKGNFGDFGNFGFSKPSNQ